MREILFRGKDESGEWKYGDFENILGTYTMITDHKNGDYTGRCVEPETVGQYTEFDDKNGKKIFERDIVLTKGKKYLVDFRGGCWIIANPEEKDFLHKHGDIEVIGNIYDNPEMLEEKE